MKKIMTLSVAVCMSLILLSCQKEVDSSEKINDILENETYMKIELGEDYHQSAVLFALQEEKAVVPKDVKWGLPKYRKKDTIGVSFGEEGTEIYKADGEMYPELYVESYLASIKNLDLSVKEVKDRNYSVKIADKEQLKWFEEELYMVSTLVIGDSYELSGVTVEFDREYRPVKKIFQLKKKNNTILGDEEDDSKKCIQKISYDVGKLKFNRQFHQVENLIGRDKK